MKSLDARRRGGLSVPRAADAAHDRRRLPAAGRARRGRRQQQRLTPVGCQLAKFPIDPRIARMVVEAKQENCLREMLIIAAALSVQDPRERPFDRQRPPTARTSSSPTSAPTSCRSSSSGLLRRGDPSTRSRTASSSRRAASTSCRTGACASGARSTASCTRSPAEMGMRPNEAPADLRADPPRAARRVCSATSARKDDERANTSARAASSSRSSPARACARQQPKWVIARRAGGDRAPLRAQRRAHRTRRGSSRWRAHLVQRALLRSALGAQAGAGHGVRAHLPLWADGHPRRRVHYGPINPQEAREIFIRGALVADEFDTRAPFFAHNRQLRRNRGAGAQVAPARRAGGRGDGLRVLRRAHSRGHRERRGIRELAAGRRAEEPAAALHDA